MAIVRKPISKKKRFDVFKRDGFVCQYCGAHPPLAVLHVDHINPVALGGGNEADNLVTSCVSCNLGKAANPLTEIPQGLKDKAEEIKERELQIVGYQAEMQKKRDRIDGEKWHVAEILVPGSSEDGIRKDWLKSICMFIEKLGKFECIDAAEIANSRFGYNTSKMFSYFCGICWSRIKEGNSA
jgi:DNA-directed RNA polymerase subunit RPC12/RpoP